MIQVVEPMPSKCEALSSNPSTAKKKKGFEFFMCIILGMKLKHKIEIHLCFMYALNTGSKGKFIHYF
jgi:hypothetical protein